MNGKTIVHECNGRRVVVADSISYVRPEDGGQVFVSASHGGTSAGEYARRHPPACVFFNDAGIGKDEAGVAGVRDLDAHGIIGAAVSHWTARIGDGGDTWENGVLSYVNETARAAGFRPGQRLRDAVQRFLEG